MASSTHELLAALALTLIALPTAACTDDSGSNDEASDTSSTGTDTVGTGTDTMGTDTAGTDTAGTDTAGTDTAGTDTAGTDTMGTDTTGQPGCLEHSSNCGDQQFEPFSCGSASPCDGLVVSDPVLNGGDGEVSFVDPAAATCIMESLRDAVPGLYVINIEPGQQYSRSHRLEVFADATVVRYEGVFDDKCFDQWERWEVLRDAAHFEGCLALATPAEQLFCMVDAGTGECIAADSCP